MSTYSFKLLLEFLLRYDILQNEVIPMTTGQLIKAARKRAGMTQTELAGKLDIPFQSVSQWERNLRKPKPETIEKIADALEVDFLDLVPENLKGIYFAAYMIRHPEITVEDEEGNVVIQGTGRIWDIGKDDAEFMMNVKEGEFHTRMNTAFHALNFSGKQEAAKRVEELTEIPRYRAETTPESTPASQEGQSTTPPPDVPETPPEGE